MGKKLWILIAIVYCFAGSTFSHVTAMDMLSVDHCGYPMSQTMDHHEETNSNCYESCMGTYDEAFGASPQQKINSIGADVGDLFLTFANPVLLAFDASTYRQLIDSGGAIPNNFSDTYIKITKKLE